MTFTDEQIAQAEATAGNLAGLLGVDRDTALRFATEILPHFERTGDLDQAIRDAADERRRITEAVAAKRGTDAYRAWSADLRRAVYPDLCRRGRALQEAA